MAEQMKFTDEELKSIHDFQTRYQQVAVQAGDAFIRKTILESQLATVTAHLDTVKNTLSTLRNEETTFGDMLQKKYGDGELNSTTGVFVPRPALS